MIDGNLGPKRRLLISYHLNTVLYWWQNVTIANPLQHEIAIVSDHSQSHVMTAEFCQLIEFLIQKINHLEREVVMNRFEWPHQRSTHCNGSLQRGILKHWPGSKLPFNPKQHSQLNLYGQLKPPGLGNSGVFLLSLINTVLIVVMSHCA